MKARSIIRWGFLVFIVAVFIFFEIIHLQIGRYNLFLVLFIFLAFAVTLGMRLLERKDVSDEQGDTRGMEAERK